MSGAEPTKNERRRPPEMNLAEFVIRVEAENANVDIPLLKQAYEFSEAAHKGQVRESGEPYINHCLTVAMILAEQHLDTATIAAGMIHDVIEDTPYSIEAVREHFGEEIAALVDGVTKISGVQFKSRAEQQVEFFRKMLLSMASDIRVIIIKLADRLHNMRTLEFLDPAKQKRIAEETREVYGPLAHRFGMARIKWELEDLTLKYLHPDVYRDLVKKVELRRGEREEYIDEITEPLADAFAEEGITAEIKGRAKHLDSIYRKMIKRRKPIEEIYDLIAIRVLTDSERDCYHALGVVHTMWTPVIDRFHDYIATPKTNMYQSLHTTVVGPRGRMVEIQIRTHQMHRTSEYGIAAHWLYKEGKQRFEETDRQMNWLREVLEWQKETRDPKEFLEFLKTDLFHDEIFVFTPKGELKRLPRGATPVDFAYAVHSEIGQRCIGARANGRIVPLSYELASGDEVEIITGNHPRPSRDWLGLVRTTRARSKIRQYFRKTGFEQSIGLGRDILAREVKRLRMTAPIDATLTDWAMAMSYADADSMLAALGAGTLSINTLINKIRPKDREPKHLSAPRRFVERARRTRGIKIQDLDNMMFRFANCCQPVPGERVVGFITRGRGVTVHRVDCSNALALNDQPERKLAVEWDVGPEQAFLVKLMITMENRKNLLRDITQAIADGEAGIQSVSLSADHTTGTGMLVIEVKNLRQLGDVMRRIRGVSGVISAERSVGPDTARGGGDGHGAA